MSKVKIGCLVKYREESVSGKIYKDWGHDRDFKVGIVIDHHSSTNLFCVYGDDKPGSLIWYAPQELEFVSDI